MTRFNEVTYHSDDQTATVGAGLLWDDVYEALDPYNVNVVGGRAGGVGVAGFSLGGGEYTVLFGLSRIGRSDGINPGYSWLSNQYGLTADNILSYEMVFPNGTVTLVDSSNTELLFALRVRTHARSRSIYH